ncbi:MAG: hypothetical protein ACK4PI_00730 [Tepidisphaerales bacterium]
MSQRPAGGRHWVLRWAGVWAALAGGGSAAVAAIPLLPSVYDTPADPTGTRSLSGGTMASDVPGWSDTTIFWTVTPNPDGTLRYTYTLTGFITPAVLLFTLDLTDNAVLDPLSVTSATVNGDPVLFALGDLDGITGAVRFEGGGTGTIVYSFDSNRAPVWGHFLIGGDAGVAVNVAFGDNTSPDPLDYIARPNGAIPEPAGLAGLALAGLLLVRRR